MSPSTTRSTTPDATPRTGRGEFHPGDPIPHRCPLRRPPPRHRRRPPPQPDRPTGPRGFALLRQAGSQLLSQRCFDRGSGPSAPWYRPAVSEAARGPRVHPSGVRPGDPRQPHRTPDSSDLSLSLTGPDLRWYPPPSAGARPPTSADARLPPSAGAHPPRALMSVLPVRRRTPTEKIQKEKNVTLRSFPRYTNRSSLYRVAQVFPCVHLVPKPQPPALSSHPRTALRRLKSRPVAPPRPPARPLHQAHPGPLRTSSGPSRVLPQTASGHWHGGWRTISGIPHRLGSSSWSSVWSRRVRPR